MCSSCLLSVCLKNFDDGHCLALKGGKLDFSSTGKTFVRHDHSLQLQETLWRRPDFSPLRWRAIIAGMLVSLAMLFTLSLLVISARVFDDANLGNARPFPWQATWHGLVVVLSAGVGGYVAARICGLNRMIDAGMHSLVTWSSYVLVLAFVVPNALGWAVDAGFWDHARGDGNTLSALTETGDSAFERELAVLIEAEPIYSESITPYTGSLLMRRIENAKKQAAINELVATMGFDQGRAVALVDRALALAKSSRNTENVNPEIDEINAWWVFMAVVLSLAGSLIGGAFAATAPRRLMLY